MNWSLPAMMKYPDYAMSLNPTMWPALHNYRAMPL